MKSRDGRLLRATAESRGGHRAGYCLEDFVFQLSTFPGSQPMCVCGEFRSRTGWLFVRACVMEKEPAPFDRILAVEQSPHVSDR